MRLVRGLKVRTFGDFVADFSEVVTRPSEAGRTACGVVADLDVFAVAKGGARANVVTGPSVVFVAVPWPGRVSVEYVFK